MLKMKRFLFVIFVVVVENTFADHYFVKEGNQVCIIMDANITGKIFYETVFNKTESYSFNVTEARLDGKCSGMTDKQMIEISFYPNGYGNASKQPWSVEFDFTRDKTKSFLLNSYQLEAVLYEDVFNITETKKVFVKDEKADMPVSAEKANGFRCSDLIIGLNNHSFIKLEGLRVIAFADYNSTEFSGDQTFEQCAFDARTSEIVPIVVGILLAVLVVVLLIAYLIGRARSRRQGYASV